jgi:acyl carrier protein
LEQKAASPQTDIALSIIRASSSQQRLSRLENFLIRLVAEVMGVKTQEFEREHPGFFQMGMDSIMAVEVIKGIEPALEIELYPTAIFDYPTIPELTTFLAGRLSQKVNGIVEENSDENKNSVIEKEKNKVIEASVAVAENKISVNDQIDRLEELLKKI